MSLPAADGLAIALAWPQTHCKQTNAWYNTPMRWLGINRHHFYKAGHAALVLVEEKSGSCRYFDFGRYHAPYQHGRVRSAETDAELAIQTTMRFGKSKQLLNLRDLLQELANRKACHGDGPLLAAYCPISYDKALNKALSLQQQSPIAYGPFVPGGTNCSRFVNTVILAGKPSTWVRLKLLLPFTLTPAPLTNVFALNEPMIKYPEQHEKTDPPAIKHPPLVKICLAAPAKPAQVPAHAQWLSGEGAGSWFSLAQTGTAYSISRYSPEGILECSGRFNHVDGPAFSMHQSYSFTFISHCTEARIMQEGKLHVFALAKD